MMRNQIFPRFSLLILVLGAGSATVLAQQTAGNQPASKPDAKPASAIKTPAHAVLLEVTVRDKKGGLVPSLDKSGLDLTEDGRPQTIQSFTLKADEPYKLGLLVQTSHSVGSALPEVGKSADQFVDTMLPAEPVGKGGDKAFLIHFDRQVELLEDFTPSRDKLHSELDQLSATHQNRDDSQGPETTGDDRERPTRARNASQLYDAIFLACDELMKHQEGRMALVVFSDGVDSGSKDTLNDAVDAADRAGVEIYTIYMKGQQQEDNFGNNGRRRGGFGYPGGGGGYPGGGGGGYPGGGGQRRESKPIVDGKKIMEEIARRTGGHAYEAKKRDELGPIYKLIAEELRAQYLLTYTPDKPDNDGGYHKLVLKANKGDLQVVTREGYYAPGGVDSK